MKLTTLECLFYEELKDLYDGEKQIARALQKMITAASSPQLTEAFNDHLEQTREHAARLARVLNALGKTPGWRKCEGIAGLMEEGDKIMKQDADPAVRDAALIAAAQRVEHYEMAGYGCVRTWAAQLGYRDAANILQRTLDEEKQADRKLTEIARVVNVDADTATS